MNATIQDVSDPFETGRNCCRVEHCARAALIIDAADYFRFARKAMMQARKQILLVGWDFDTRITLDHDADDGAPTRLGPFLSWLPDARPGLHIYLLKWDVGAIKLLGRGSTILRIARWAWDRDISFSLDGAHPPGASHHHKIAVIDDQLAFCGGIDMTADRWDTSEHLDEDDRRKRPTTRRRYGPWHDATMAVDGDVARALGDIARDRWLAAGGTPIEPPTDTRPIWPEGLDPQFEKARVAISRTRARFEGRGPAREIEALFVDQIKRAERFIYIENQYFASRAIAAAIVERLAEPLGPEFVVVNPRTGEDWLDDEVMSAARAQLLKVIAQSDFAHRFRIYSPVTAGGEDIYVHSKILIADDELIRVGSANLNNRSMGFDSECDLTIDVEVDGNGHCADMIARIRERLLGEHLGVPPERVREEFRRSESLIATIETLRGSPRTLEPLVPEEPNLLEKAAADNNVLDPEVDVGEYEPMAKRPFFGAIRNIFPGRSNSNA